MEEYSIPALVFGVGVTLTGVLRTLGQSGIRAYTVCDRADIATRSRWFVPPPSGDASHVRPENLAAFLNSCGVPKAVLVPCSDDWARAVAQLPSSFSDRFFTSTSPADVVEALIDKWKFAKLCDDTDVPRPRTQLMDRAGSLQAAPDDVFRGAFLKPLSSGEFARRHGVKGFTVESRSEALSLLNVLDLPVMLQEYIPGPPTAHYFIEGFRDRTGTIRGLLARQRLRMFPLDLGNSSLMISVALSDVAPAAAALTRLLEHINYRGVFSAEFKLDPRDNRFKILEVNARPWWYVEFAARCGLDVCKMSYRDALRLPIASIETYQVGRRCMMLAIDMLAFHAMHRNPGSIRFTEWLESLRDADDALFSSRDPLPAFAHWSRLLKQRLVPAGTFSTAVPQVRVHRHAAESTPSETLVEAGPVRRG